jgi:SAM-dependent methyltransferase
MATPRDTYTHGHHDSVLRSHRWRTAENSAAYLLPHLRPGMSLLDVGCGPGTQSVDLARRIAPGRVLAVDRVDDALDEARRHAADAGVDSIEFRVADGYALGLPDRSFDVVHAHQVLHHVSDPVSMLREFRRARRDDGVVAVREADYTGIIWHPSEPGLDRWRQLLSTVARDNDGEPDADGDCSVGPATLGSPTSRPRRRCGASRHPTIGRGGATCGPTVCGRPPSPAKRSTPG